MDTTTTPNVCCISTPSRAWGTDRTTTKFETSDKSWATKMAEKDATTSLVP